MKMMSDFILKIIELVKGYYMKKNKAEMENHLNNLLMNYNPNMDKTIINFMSKCCQYESFNRKGYMIKLTEAWEKYQIERMKI